MIRSDVERRPSLTTLPTVGLSILVLLALSSHRSRDFAHHRREAAPEDLRQPSSPRA